MIAIGQPLSSASIATSNEDNMISPNPAATRPTVNTRVTTFSQMKLRVRVFLPGRLAKPTHRLRIILMNAFAGDLPPAHGFRLVARIIF